MKMYLLQLLLRLNQHWHTPRVSSATLSLPLPVLQYSPVYMLTGSLPRKKPSEYIFTSEARLHLQSHSSLIFLGYITQPADCERWCTRTPLTGWHKPTCLSHPGLIQFHCHSRGNRVWLYLLTVSARKRGSAGWGGWLWWVHPRVLPVKLVHSAD